MSKPITPDTVSQALQWRYAVQVFDPNKPVSSEDLRAILDSGRLAPSSLGLEPWHFIVVDDPAVRRELRAASYDQPKVTDAARLIVIAYRTDVAENVGRERLERTAATQGQRIEELGGLKKLIDGSVARHTAEGTLEMWIKAQAYIPLGIMIETAALLGIDNAPMEGFSAQKVDQILGLEAKHLRSTVFLALGHRGQDPAAQRPKVRRAFDDVVTFIA